MIDVSVLEHVGSLRSHQENKLDEALMFAFMYLPSYPLYAITYVLRTKSLWHKAGTLGYFGLFSIKKQT